MAKFSGKLGFAESYEAEPGIWKQRIIEKRCYGDIVRNTRRIQSADQVNDNILLSNDFSIVADSFIRKNFSHMLYLEYEGVKWKISTAEIKYPRIRLTVGEVLNDGT